MKGGLIMEPIGEIISVTLNEDKTVAYLQFLKKEENFACTADVLRNFLQANGVKHGIQQDIVERFAINPSEYFFSRTPIAIGSEPMDGRNGSIRYAVRMDDNQHK